MFVITIVPGIPVLHIQFGYSTMWSNGRNRKRCHETFHDDVIKWKHFPRHRPFVRGIHQSPVNSPHKGQWRGTLMFSLICARVNCWVKYREAGDLRRHRAHYDVIVMYLNFEMTATNQNNLYCIFDTLNLIPVQIPKSWYFEITPNYYWTSF